MTSTDDLDRLTLTHFSGVIQRAGRLSLSAGAGSYRVKETMARIARALGIERHQAHVTLTEITTTAYLGSAIRTEVAEVREMGVNTDRLAELEVLAQRVEAGRVPPHEVGAEIDRIEAKPHLYPIGLNAVWAGLACAAFSFLNGGGAVEMIGALVGAVLGQAVRRLMLRRRFNQLGVTMVAATVASVAYLAFVGAVASVAGAPLSAHSAGFVAAALFLVPGFPLVNGALDFAKLDFSAGVARLTWALTIFVSAAFAVWAVSVAVPGVAPFVAAARPVTAGYVALWALASFVGVLGFALMFNSPWRMAVVAAAVATVPNVGRIVVNHLGVVPPQVAAAAAALLVGLLAAWAAPRLNIPRITVYVPAVTIMVPGVAAYQAVSSFNNHQVITALENGVNAALVVAALAVGLAIARMVTDPAWGYER